MENTRRGTTSAKQRPDGLFSSSHSYRDCSAQAAGGVMTLMSSDMVLLYGSAHKAYYI